MLLFSFSFFQCRCLAASVSLSFPSRKPSTNLGLEINNVLSKKPPLPPPQEVLLSPPCPHLCNLTLLKPPPPPPSPQWWLYHYLRQSFLPFIHEHLSSAAPSTRAEFGSPSTSLFICCFQGQKRRLRTRPTTPTVFPVAHQVFSRLQPFGSFTLVRNFNWFTLNYWTE